MYYVVTTYNVIWLIECIISFLAEFGENEATNVAHLCMRHCFNVLMACWLVFSACRRLEWPPVHSVWCCQPCYPATVSMFCADG